MCRDSHSLCRLTHCMLGNFSCFLKKFFQAYHQLECQTFWTLIRPDNKELKNPTLVNGNLMIMTSVGSSCKKLECTLSGQVMM